MAICFLVPLLIGSEDPVPCQIINFTPSVALENFIAVSAEGLPLAFWSLFLCWDSHTLYPGFNWAHQNMLIITKEELRVFAWKLYVPNVSRLVSVRVKLDQFCDSPSLKIFFREEAEIQGGCMLAEDSKISSILKANFP